MEGLYICTMKKVIEFIITNSRSVMQNNTVIILIVISVVISVIMISRRCRWTCNTTHSERFGQDASVRVQSGWIAGHRGMYGYDPIDQFAAQISTMKARKRAGRASRGEISLGIMEGRDLVDSPTKFIGPIERYREGHYPYILKKHCIYQHDCLEGEKCLTGVCVSAEIETYRENYSSSGEVPTPDCKACMTTEDFEMVGQ